MLIVSYGAVRVCVLGGTSIVAFAQLKSKRDMFYFQIDLFHTAHPIRSVFFLSCCSVFDRSGLPETVP